ncbi:huntingtin-interacting protein 1 isoform X2 [Bacillus rossius redtenbacheri]|uniref:huntingtin-interacting protein 1 isoform X2 n=1 Tax=Bacillus rossius redtenbacheri TaxID=93214 RepID=UPI002FDD3C21
MNLHVIKATSISKAINVIENPVKEKHVRSTIIGTFHEKGANTFWACALRLPLQENRIVAWKFCHVLHKVLREGHPQVLGDSQRFRPRLDDLGKLWVHLREGYGKLIQLYCQLLISKLDFHRRNPRFPGNLQVTKEELESIGENDINNYFQMSVEMFDYMDDILNLQSAIFGSLDMSRSNSMTSCGQCRLAPLIPCIQDSSRLYDYCVKILFKLHASLPPDILAGHRERFLKQFKELRQFYLNANTMQYFRTLIQIPLLPDAPPNLLIQAELRSYVTPVVVLPPEPQPQEEVDGQLVDTSDSGSLVELAELAQRNGSVSPDLLQERDSLIEQLQGERVRLRDELLRLTQEHQASSQRLADRMLELETQLATKDSELMQERQLKEDLMQHTEVAARCQETEEKHRAVEAKFQKLKEVYTKLRDEHVQLIRQKAEVVRQLETDRLAALAAQAALDARLQEVSLEKSLAHETLQRSGDLEGELQSVRAVLLTAQADAEAANSRLQFVSQEKGVLESELQDLLAQKEALDVRLREREERLASADVASEGFKTRLQQLFETCLATAESIVKKSVAQVGDPALSALKGSPDYLRGLAEPLELALGELAASHDSYRRDPAAGVDAVSRNAVLLSHLVADYLLHGRGTANVSPDIELGERLEQALRALGADVLGALGAVRGSGPLDLGPVRARLGELQGLVGGLASLLAGHSQERVADLVERELADMDKAIEEAARSIQELLRSSRAADSGIKLEVNEKILDSCTTLMQAIRALVQKSRLLQAEIVAQGKGTASAKEFYKRNHQWTEGLISAAKSVAVGAQLLLTAADGVVSGQGQFSRLVVASQEIAASTAQLVVASRVKAERHSPNLGALAQASRTVTQATGTVVATAQSCSELVQESDDLDVSGLSQHQAKRLEYESQVRVIELETSLQRERERLAALRRHHYRLAADDGEPQDAPSPV